MAKFLFGDELILEKGKLFEKAKEQIIIISPFIKLHKSYRDILEKKINDTKLELTIVFGKNEGKMYKSVLEEDINFFKQFLDVEIRYEPKLHAKYYANDKNGILTSMNLHSYSQENNIEVGIRTKVTLLGQIGGFILEDTIDTQAFNYFIWVIDNSKLLYKRVAHYDTEGLFNKTRKYLWSNVELDEIDQIFIKEKKSKTQEKIEVESKKEPVKSSQETKHGFCIRTGVVIPFNINKPYSNEAYKSWIITGNKTEPEHYCHFSGEPSNGKTSYARPILWKNWNIKLQKFYSF